MADCNPVSTPMLQRLSAEHGGRNEGLWTIQEHGWHSFFFVMMSRPDISFAVCERSRFVAAPGHLLLAAANHLIRYIQCSWELEIMYSKASNSGATNQPDILWGFRDSDCADCPDRERSMAGFTVMLNGAAGAWKSKCQSVAALTFAEADSGWVHCIMGFSMPLLYQRWYIVDFCWRILVFHRKNLRLNSCADNHMCITWTQRSVGGIDRAKHVDPRAHIVHVAVEAKILKLMPVNSVDNIVVSSHRYWQKFLLCPRRKRCWDSEHSPNCCFFVVCDELRRCMVTDLRTCVVRVSSSDHGQWSSDSARGSDLSLPVTWFHGWSLLSSSEVDFINNPRQKGSFLWHQTNFFAYKRFDEESLHSLLSVPE